jgi:cleavage and polyadenylation specificity factor subunit 1
MSSDASLSQAHLRVDPMSRCGALLLPMSSIAILPFFQTQVELELPEQDQSQAK